MIFHSFLSLHPTTPQALLEIDIEMYPVEVGRKMGTKYLVRELSGLNRLGMTNKLATGNQSITVTRVIQC